MPRGSAPSGSVMAGAEEASLGASLSRKSTCKLPLVVISAWMLTDCLCGCRGNTVEKLSMEEEVYVNETEAETARLLRALREQSKRNVRTPRTARRQRDR